MQNLLRKLRAHRQPPSKNKKIDWSHFNILGFGERIIYDSRWLLFPVSLGMTIALALYVTRFCFDVEAFVVDAWNQDTEALRVFLLGLIDTAMVANLLAMIVAGNHQIFVRRFQIGDESNRPQWLDHIDSGILKIKVALSISSITLVQLLKDFVNIENLDWDIVVHRMWIHGMCLVSALAMAIIWRVTYTPDGHHHDNHELAPPATHSFLVRLMAAGERVVYESRWLLFPVNFGMVIAFVAYVLRFCVDVKSLVLQAFSMDMEAMRVLVLGLVDTAMVATLLVMIIKGSHQIFIRRFPNNHSSSRPQWLDHIDSGLLKIKVALAIAGITLVQILKDFVNVEHIDWVVVVHQMYIHALCLVSALIMAIIWKVTHPSEPADGHHDAGPPAGGHEPEAHAAHAH
jgi:uncharacterized protein (TIGR00645 family)